MSKFLKKFKKPCFWPIFGLFSQFWGQKKFTGKLDDVTHNFIWVSSTMRKYRKNDKILRKRTEGQKDGRTDRLYFIRPFRLPPGVQKSRKKPDTKQLKIYA